MNLVSSAELIAIVGIGCRFPGGVTSPDAYWQLLLDGVDAISDIPAERWNLAAFYDAEPGVAGKTVQRRGGFIEHVDRFHPQAFGISPREAASIDPQQRLLLETAWEAIDDAGQTQHALAGSRTGVFVGLSGIDYAVLQTGRATAYDIDVYTSLGCSNSIAANRVSYTFDLRGPSLSVDTACSSSLVALHLACESLKRQECTAALAGGVNLLLTPESYIGFSRMGMLSPQGQCRAFDAGANGFVRSEGAGMLLLKPLSRAIADRDRIYALIRGTGVNQDGRTSGITVPSQAAQAALMREACRRGGIDPKEISYVEAHGTGTLVGDPIEIRALGEVLRESRAGRPPCWVGSCKTNIGHLEAASGMAGLVKVALMLQRRRIPRNLHFQVPNPEIDFDGLNLRVPVQTESWPAENARAIAAINSFGFGGTNAHAILEEPPTRTRSTPSKRGEPAAEFAIPLSAHSPESLQATVREWQAWLAQREHAPAIQDLAYTAGLRRTHHGCRALIIAKTLDDIRRQLHELAVKDAANMAPTRGMESGLARRIVFVCGGQGPQWWGMGRELLQSNATFRRAIAECDEILRRWADWSLLDELSATQAASRMNETAIAQSCLFALQIALAAVWREWGIEPAAIIGHSVGEVAAAYLAGALTLPDAVKVIFERGRCMSFAGARGRMLAVGISPAEAERLIASYGGAIEIAAVNSPVSVTLTGPADLMESLAADLSRQKLYGRLLNVQDAFHSALLDPVREPLMDELRNLDCQTASRNLISTVTADWSDGLELGPDYWWRNVRQPVRFAEAIDRLLREGYDAFLELGPHPVLSTSLIECARLRGKPIAAVPSIRRQEGERQQMLVSLGRLYAYGADVKWEYVNPIGGEFVRLPNYAWQRERTWHETPESIAHRLGDLRHPLLGRPDTGATSTWRRRVVLRELRYLADHRVQGSVVLPAAASLELALAARQAIHGTGPHILENIQIDRPILLSGERDLLLQTSWNPAQRLLQIHSRPVDAEQDWLLHATVALRAQAPQTAPPQGDLNQILGRCYAAYSGAEVYEAYRRGGLDFGAHFRGIDQLHIGAGEALAKVRLPANVLEHLSEYTWHPAAIDVCLHAVGGLDAILSGSQRPLRLPVEIGQVRCYAGPTPELWSHAKLIERSDRSVSANVCVYNADGTCLLEIRGLVCRTVAGAPANDSIENLLYSTRYRQSDQIDAAGRSLSQTPRRHLVFADESGIGAELCRRWSAGGDECWWISRGHDFHQTADAQFSINPAHPDDYRKLFQSLPALGNGESIEVIHLWNVDAPDDSNLDAAALESWQELGLLSLLYLVQTLHDLGIKARLRIVTRGAQAMRHDASPLRIAAAPVFGLTRVIGNEMPNFRCQLIDLDPNDGSHSIHELWHELNADLDDEEVVLRNHERWVAVYDHTPLTDLEPAAAEKRRPARYRLAAAEPVSLDSLSFREMDRQELAADEVEVAVEAAGLNFSDLLKSLALYPGLPAGPLSLGAECSGRISAVGEDAGEWQVGDEVVAVAPFALASHTTARRELIFRKPAELSFEEAAALPIAYLTASYALETIGRLAPGERVLIHSATGGVGMAALQIARNIGAEVFATAGTPAKREWLRSLGVAHVMDSRTLDFGDEILAATHGEGVDVVLNSLPGAAIVSGLSVLRECGRFLEIGKRDIYENAPLGLKPFRKNVSFHAIDLDRLLRERPAVLRPVWQRLEQQIRSGQWQPLPVQAFSAANFDQALRLLQQGRHQGKVVVSMSSQPDHIHSAEPGPLQLRHDASYLITGGTRGFGLACARWLAQQGAGELVLMSRRPFDAADGPGILAELKSCGAKVTVLAGDIAAPEEVAGAFRRIDAECLPLAGVIHAAMILEDGMLVNQHRDSMLRILKPKVSGAWNLHHETRARPLDFFVMFSSLSSVVGHKGQANYGAANAFLDHLAHFRRACGLPSSTINWGYLGDVGTLARNPNLGGRLEQQGIRPIPLTQSLEALEFILQRQPAQVGVMRMDWSRWQAASGDRISPRFARLCRSDLQQERALAGATSMRQQVLDCADCERSALLTRLLQNKLAQVLGVSSTELDPRESLLRLGLDSLVAVELHHWLERELGSSVPVVELLGGSGIAAVAETLARQLAGREHDPAVDAGETRAAKNWPTSDDVRRMNDGEVDRLLAELLPQDGRSTFLTER